MRKVSVGRWHIEVISHGKALPAATAMLQSLPSPRAGGCHHSPSTFGLPLACRVVARDGQVEDGELSPWNPALWRSWWPQRNHESPKSKRRSKTHLFRPVNGRRSIQKLLRKFMYALAFPRLIIPRTRCPCGLHGLLGLLLHWSFLHGWLGRLFLQCPVEVRHFDQVLLACSELNAIFRLLPSERVPQFFFSMATMSKPLPLLVDPPMRCPVVPTCGPEYHDWFGASGPCARLWGSLVATIHLCPRWDRRVRVDDLEPDVESWPPCWPSPHSLSKFQCYVYLRVPICTSTTLHRVRHDRTPACGPPIVQCPVPQTQAPLRRSGSCG